MTAQGLLVKGRNGEEFLLAVEPRVGMRAYRLVARRRINGKWQQMSGPQERARRESLLGAFVEFFVDLCRVLNSSDHQPASEAVPVQQPSPGVKQATGPVMR